MHIIVISYIVHVSCVCCLSVVVYVCVYIYIHTYIMCWSGPADLERVVVFSCFYCVRVCPVFIVFPCGVVSCVVSFHGLCLCVCCLAVVVYVFIYQLLVGPFGLGTLVVVIVVLLLLLLYLFVYLHIYIYIYCLSVVSPADLELYDVVVATSLLPGPNLTNRSRYGSTCDRARPNS